MELPKGAAQTALFFSIALLGLIVLPLPPLPAALTRHELLWHVVENLGHPFVFGLLACFALKAGWNTRLILLWAVALALGSEALQFLTHRDPALDDVANDVLGATLVLALRRARHATARRWKPLVAACGALLLAPPIVAAAAYIHRRLQAPLLWSADSKLDRMFSHEGCCVYPGLTIDEPLPDWSGYRWLDVDVENTAEQPVRITVRVHDLVHDHRYEDRYNGDFVLAPGRRQVLAIPMEKIVSAPAGRRMDLSRIRGVVVFRSGEDLARRVQVHGLALAR